MFRRGRDGLASAKPAHHGNDVVNHLPSVRVLGTAHTAHQLQSSVVLDGAFGERALPLELLSPIYQSLLVDRNSRHQLDFLVNRSHGVMRVGLDYPSFPIGNRSYEELQPRLRPGGPGPCRASVRGRSGIGNPRTELLRCGGGDNSERLGVGRAMDGVGFVFPHSDRD